MSLPMRSSRRGRGALALGLALAVLASAGVARAQSASQGVFLRLADARPGSLDAVAQSLKSAMVSAGWTVLADYESGVNRSRCAYRARVLVASWPEYTAAVLKEGAQGAFALPLRLEVFEDEGGVHVAAVNPRSVNRTIVLEQGREAEWARLSERLAAVVHAAAPGTEQQYGQRREKARIGKTMGVMAGGPFQEKVKTILAVPAGAEGVRGVARRLYAGLQEQAAAGEWKLRPVFLHESGNVAVLGITGEPMEAKSFDIVGAGGDGARKSLRCPGIDHAAAYPLELVLVLEGAQVQVRTVDEMFRMKLYFEDAGMMAFARNMGMPGSIGDEVRRKVTAALR